MNIDIQNEELKALLTQAAKDGAKQALAEVGLDGANAQDDIKELRNLIDSWRYAKKTMGQTALKIATSSVLIFIAVAVFMKLGINLGESQ
jgi:phage terminase Nu1 subunit (DNA packaging protein)